IPHISLTHTAYFYSCLSGYHLHLPSFPTRRSSDLPCPDALLQLVDGAGLVTGGLVVADHLEAAVLPRDVERHATNVRRRADTGRSEEHTSELQSRENLVCRLLLEKKNNDIKNINAI